ncbi:hypothetical protein IEQ34_017503 [Dendrobium chrysotoxum]|uniref:mRNA-decapping enzyme-like protein n=1 Tax=Dendrobium chrysotoxum TaxID=161865 RepID=A0AAV7FU66_DENCH|nr:hypothetical protein IEQ34_017503 [Dendrobium chrysotoxum]
MSKLMPNLDQQSTKVLNLTVLQRIDPYVEEILMTAAHVTFYEFSIEQNRWSRKDVEGSLFVVKRNTQPRFQFIVMNRRSTGRDVELFLAFITCFSHLEALLDINLKRTMHIEIGALLHRHSWDLISSPTSVKTYSFS